MIYLNKKNIKKKYIIFIPVSLKKKNYEINIYQDF